jgi:hypothetical protein
MPAPALRPRSMVEIIDASFQILRRNYLSLVTATVALALPVVVLRLVLPVTMQWLPQILSWLLQTASSAAVVLLVSETYLGREADVGAALRTVFSRFGSIFGASLMQGIIVGLGLLLLIVPGIIFLAWTFAMPAVVVLENSGAGESFTRSRELTRGSVGRILGTLLVTYILFFVIVISLAMAAGTVVGLSGGSGVAAKVIGDVLASLIFPMVAVVTTLLYYDLRIRKEGFDLEVMAQELGGGSPPPRPSASAA